MNSLLPKKGDFSNKGYWNKFFNSRKVPFEWYGDFVQHIGYFRKYVRASDNVLIIGCGNSELGVMLLEKFNCCSVMNIDISEDVIQQMRHKYQTYSTNVLSFECANVLELEERISSGVMPLFKCVVDKGTLDAIYSEDESDFVVDNMFDNISASLTLMGRYMLVTLAQGHIVNAICHYFITSHSEWMINCHQLTSNSVSVGDKQPFCLPVFGFVFTKLRPTNQPPRISVFPFNSDEPTRLDSQGLDTSPESLRLSLKDWIIDQQGLSSLRHNLKAGDETEFRFTSSLSPMTVFYCCLVRLPVNRILQSNKRGKNPKRQDLDVKEKIDAIFLVPYGQNYCTSYSSEDGRRALCRSLKLESLLFVFANPRMLVSDLELVKGQLSEALGNLQCTHIAGAPILSTPNSYLRREVLASNETVDQPDPLVIDEIELSVDQNSSNGAIAIRRLVCSTADMRPIVTTVSVLKSELPIAVLSPRDLHTHILFYCLSGSMESCLSGVTINSLYLGLPSILPENPSSLDIHPIGTDFKLLCAIASLMQHLCNASSIRIPTFITEIDDITELYNVILYDPWTLRHSDHDKQYLTDAITTLLTICDRCLAVGGWLVIFTEECCTRQQADVLRQIDSMGSLSHLLSFPVPDSLFADPVTQLHLFAKTNTPRDQLASFFKNRLDSYIDKYCTPIETADATMRRDACCKLQDALC